VLSAAVSIDRALGARKRRRFVRGGDCGGGECDCKAAQQRRKEQLAVAQPRTLQATAIDQSITATAITQSSCM